YRIDAGSAPEQIIAMLEEKLYEHNSKRIGKGGGDLFCRVVRSSGDEIIGGVAGWIWAGACEISQLWVDERVRGEGIGQLLLGAAEEEARSRGGVTVLIRSFSFQAPQFYVKNGYRVEHVIDDFPPGYRYYILMKAIV
ncbi:MAG TPA: GNAT family N-acetyltransferase, partial [Puia sp.]